MARYELIRVFISGGFTLRMWDTFTRDSRGQTVLAYELKDGRTVVFSGEDFAGSPMHADDSIETVASLLSFLSLKPGDTDREYFDSYTPEQMQWCTGGRADDLSMIAMELEDASSRRRERARSR
jgi:hypothetical protein